MSSITKKFEAVLTLGRISNLPTVWTNCIAAWALNQLGTKLPLFVLPDENVVTQFGITLTQLIWILLGSSLIYISGTTLNYAFDVDFDKKHNIDRPIPSGVMQTWEVWSIGFIELGVGVFILIKYISVNPLYLSLLCIAIISYDAIHKKWSGSVWLMGGCRLFLWWTIASAIVGADQSLSNLVYIWSITLLLYIAGITFVARGEATGKLPVIPWPFFLLYSPAILGVFFCFHGSKWLVIPLLIVFAFGVNVGIQNARRKGSGIGLGVSLWLALITLSDAIAVCLVHPLLGYLLALGFPLCLWMQKRFAAT